MADNKLLKQTNLLKKRLTTYSLLSEELGHMSEEELAVLIQAAEPLGSSIGGNASLLQIGNNNIFIKKIRLSQLESLPENYMNTTNLFNCPPYYQYGIGSSGFGAWRELSVHIMTTNWVLSGECVHFPLMYHWQVLPAKPIDLSENVLKEIDEEVSVWGGEPFIRERVLAKFNALNEIVLFLEFIPENLYHWLQKEVNLGEKQAELACAKVDAELQSVLSFINSRGLLHFDAHFNNILTDGSLLYFSDFGLAVSDQFELSEIEKDFFNKHYNYDKCYMAFYYVHWMMRELFGVEKVDDILREYAKTKSVPPLSPQLSKIFTRYAPAALIMNGFYKALRKDRNQAQYPVNALASLNKERLGN